MSEKNLSQAIRERMQAGNKRFWAGDNVSDYITPWDKEMLSTKQPEHLNKCLTRC